MLKKFLDIEKMKKIIFFKFPSRKVLKCLPLKFYLEEKTGSIFDTGYD
jgi:hypothetical protein